MAGTQRSTLRVLRAVACVLAALIVTPASHTASAAPAMTVAKKKPKKTPKKAKSKVTVVAQQKKPPPPPPLDGQSYDYDYDGRDVGHPERRWMGRAFVHKQAAALAGQPLPVLVFLHGNNNEAIKYRWMGGGSEGDIRRIVSELIDGALVPPMLVAAPSSIDPNTMTNAAAAWPAFDLDHFLDRTAERLGASATIDRSRVIVAAHSGAGCNIRGGLATAVHAKVTPVLAGISIDTCMLLDLAASLARVRPTTHVVVSWQSISWPEREFGLFRTLFLKEAQKSPPASGVLRELDFMQPNVVAPHDAMVAITLRKYLPRILNPGPRLDHIGADAGAPVAPDAGN